MPYALCRHIRTNGRRCKAASLTDNSFCYFHQHLHRSHKGFRHTEATRAYLLPGQHIELNTLEDRESVQLALSVVINALATGQLDTRRANAILYGLQVASHNAATLDASPGSDAVRAVESSPDGVDLAEPAVAETIMVSPRLDADEEDEEDDEDDDDEEDDDEDDRDRNEEAEDATEYGAGDDLAAEPQPPLQRVHSTDPALFPMLPLK